MNIFLRPALTLSLLCTLLTGLAYPLLCTSLAQGLFPRGANGSLIERNGVAIGSALIGQAFTSAGYFHPRPSATTPAYNAAASAGSNLAPSARELREAITQRGAAYGGGALPADLVTASGSGLDPHLSPAAALIQIPRVAQARGLGEARLRDLVERQIEGRDFGLLGQPRVNVLALNLTLDKLRP